MTSVISDDGDVAAEISDLVAAGLQLAVAQAREEVDDDLAVQVFSLLTPGVILARAIDLELPSDDACHDRRGVGGQKLRQESLRFRFHRGAKVGRQERISVSYGARLIHNPAIRHPARG